MTYIEVIEALKGVTKYVENTSAQFLDEQNLGEHFETIKNNATIASNAHPGGIDRQLAYIDGITNGVVDALVKNRGVDEDVAREEFVKYYSSGK